MLQHSRPFDAVLVDLDGTLLDESSELSARKRDALRELEARGVVCMVATGRSLIATLPILEQLQLLSPALVFNGAGIYCPQEERFLEEQPLSDRTLERALRYSEERELLTVVMRSREKFSVEPRDEIEASGIQHLSGVNFVGRDALAVEYAMRVTLFSREHEDSKQFHDEVESFLASPSYLTHFPLDHLPHHRSSPLLVVDVQPPCLGKAEAFRFLGERYGIDPARVIAFGDASNDIPMFERAGRSVAMEDGMHEAVACADVVIGDNDSEALAEYLEDVFGL